MSRFLIKADGPDASGIVAAVTGALEELQCNLQDTSMTRLGGYFAMLLVVDSSADVDVDVFAQDFVRRTSHLRLDVSVEAIPEGSHEPITVGDVWAITLTDTDQPGVVTEVSHYLAEIGANIDELSTRIVGVSSATYTVLIDVTVPTSVDRNAMLERLDAIASKVGSSCDARLVGHG